MLFCSGSGSLDMRRRRLHCRHRHARDHGDSSASLLRRFRPRAIFAFGRRLLLHCSAYTGVDVVKDLIARNALAFGSDRVRFVALDIVSDPLPQGDVCFVRQVLQHLSNDQITAVLPKLRAFEWVFITEHYPAENLGVRFNVDKVHGGDIRLYENSGVYLCEPPFSLPREEVSMVLEVPASNASGTSDGVIRTFLYRPGHATR